MKTASTFWRARLVRALPLAALALASLAQAGTAVPTDWRTDCVGYHAMQLPGGIEYAVLQRRPDSPWRTAFDFPWEPAFSDGLGVWANNWDVTTDTDWPDDGNDRIRLTSPANIDDLKALMAAKNKEQQKKKDEFLELADFIDKNPDFAKTSDPDGREQKNQREKAAQVPFYEPVPDRAAFSIPSKISGLLDFQVLIGNRIVSATRKLVGTPQQTVDAFLNHYKPREPFEVPNGPGVCLPYATMTGETRPAFVGMSIRLKDRPDIVVYLHDTKVHTDGNVPDPKEVLAKEIRLATHGARDAIASNKLKPFHSVSLAGQEGVGAFVTIFRDPEKGSPAANHKVKPETDWGYVAYSPGDKNAPVGTSSDLMFKVLRYGRYAKQPMTEKEFRKLAETITASIKRRPGAWASR